MNVLKALRKLEEKSKVDVEEENVKRTLIDINGQKIIITDIIVEGVKDPARARYCHDEIVECIEGGMLRTDHLERAVMRISNHVNFKNVELYLVKKPDFTLFTKPFYLTPWNKSKRSILLFVDETKWFSGNIFGGIENNHLFGKTGATFKNKLPGFMTVKLDAKMKSKNPLLKQKSKAKAAKVTDDDHDGVQETDSKKSIEEGGSENVDTESEEAKEPSHPVGIHSDEIKTENRVYLDVLMQDTKLFGKGVSRYDFGSYLGMIDLNFIKHNNGSGAKKGGRYCVSTTKKFAECFSEVSCDEFVAGVTATKYISKAAPFEATQGTFVSSRHPQRNKGRGRFLVSAKASHSAKANCAALAGEICYENERGHMRNNISAALGIECGLFNKVTDSKNKNAKEGLLNEMQDETSSSDSHDGVNDVKPYVKAEASSSIHVPIYKKLVAHGSVAVGALSEIGKDFQIPTFSKVETQVPDTLLFNIGQKTMPGFSSRRTTVYTTARASLSVPIFDAAASVSGFITKRQGKTEPGVVERTLCAIAKNVEVTPFIQCSKMAHEDHPNGFVVHGGITATFKKTLSASVVVGGEERFCLGVGMSF